MNLPRLRALLLIMIVVYFHRSTHAQTFSNKLTQYENSAALDIEVLNDTTSVILIHGYNPSLVYIHANGNVIKTVDLTPHINLVYDIIVDDGEVIIVGSVKGAGAVKIDKNGSVVWAKTLDSGVITTIVKYKDDYIMIGNNSQQPNKNHLVTRISKNGDVMWQKNYPISSDYQAGKILINNDRVYTIFRSLDEKNGVSKLYVAELNPANGAYLWTKNTVYPYETEYYTDRPMPIGATIHNNQIIIAYPGYNFVDIGAMVKYDLKGNLLENSRQFNLQNIVPHDIQVDVNGDIVLCGTYVGLSSTQKYVRRTNNLGELIWEKKYGNGTILKTLINNDQIIIIGCEDSYYEIDNFKNPIYANLSTDGKAYTSGVNLTVRKASANDCNSVETEPIDEIIEVYIDNMMVNKISKGDFYIDLPIGEYDISYKIPSYYTTCDWPIKVKITDDKKFQNLNLVLNEVGCSDLHVAITNTELIRNQSNDLYISYQNKGNESVENAYIILNLDPRIILVGTKSTYCSTMDGKIRFDLPSMLANTEGRIKLSLRINDSVSLYTNLSAAIEIFPHTNCAKGARYEDYFEIETDCDGEQVVFTVRNKGNAMPKSQKYKLLRDGYEVASGDYKLANEAVLNISLPTYGKVATLLLYHEASILQSQSYEGCGQTANGYQSTGVASLFNTKKLQPYTDQTYLEVREYKDRSISNNSIRYFTSINFGNSTPNNNGIGYLNVNCYNVTPDTLRDLQLYINYSGAILHDSIHVRAASHDYSVAYREGMALMKINEKIAPNEGFQSKILISLSNNSNYPYKSAVIKITENGELINKFSQGFVDIEACFITDSIEQKTTLKNGNILGRNYAKNLIHSIIPLDNGTKIVVGITEIKPYLNRLVAYKIDKNEKWVWTKEYSLCENYFAFIPINDVMMMPNCNIIILTNNGILTIDTDGNRVNQSTNDKLKAELLNYNLLSIAIQDDNKRIIIARNFNEYPKEYFKILLTNNMKIISITEIDFQIDGKKASFDRINKNNDGIMLMGKSRSYRSENSTYFILFRKDGTEYRSEKFGFVTGSKDAFYMNDVCATRAGKVAVIGSLQKLVNNQYISLTNIIETDHKQKIINEIQVFPDKTSYILQKLSKKNENYITAGLIWLDSIRIYVPFIIELTPDGEVKWLVMEDLSIDDVSCQRITLGADGRVFATFSPRDNDSNNNVKMGYIYSPDETVDRKFDNPTNRNKLIIYPNPTSSHLYIHTPENQTQYTHYQIYSIQGQSVRNGNYLANCIDVSSLISGTYILQMNDVSGQRKFEIFIKL